MQDSLNPDPPGREMAASLQLHGVLVRVLGQGVLLVGESGIGKSECALDLITKGHQLVADDVVEVRIADAKVSGSAPELTFELLEIRGLGIINVRELFGVTAVEGDSAIDLCVELQKWSEVERVENVIGEYRIADCVIPKFVLPVSSGRNLSTLVEAAARLFINRASGSDTTQVLLEKHAALLDRVN